MGFFTKNELRDPYFNSKTLNESLRKSITSEYLNSKEFDIFLSHSIKDSEYISKLKQELEENFGYSVYVDWMEDSKLDRNSVDKKTAAILQKRMQQSKCLFFITSENSSNSKWMPWELGYFDGLKPKKVAILPITDYSSSDFKGQEYLGLYPVIDKGKIKDAEKEVLWVNESKQDDTYVQLEFWLNGTQPFKRS